MNDLVQTFTWVILPKGKRIKIILPLDERLRIYPALFTKKFGTAPRFIFMRREMTEDWESDVVEGMEIVKLEKGYPLHMYSLAVNREDFSYRYSDRAKIRLASGKIGAEILDKTTGEVTKV